MASEAAAESVADGSEADAEGTDTEDGKHILYFTMPTERALKRLLRQWTKFSKGEDPETDYKALWAIFGYLSDLRVWSIEDRLDPHLRNYVAAMLRRQREVVIELDLWYRSERERRDGSLETIQKMLDEVDGKMLDSIDIPEIRYQGALIQVPGAAAREISRGSSKIALLNEVMTIRPQSSYSSRLHDEGSKPKSFPAAPRPLRRCVAAILDGYPVSQHAALVDRLHIVEVDVGGGQVPVDSRRHGTAMASLILHGDLGSQTEQQLDRMLTVLPVLSTNADGTQETTPAGSLPIAVIYRALRAIVDADPDDDPDLADVVVVNHSICDDYAPFTRRLSPWAALLDYFSHRHRLLFVVSAGNISSDFRVDEYADLADFNGDDPQVREHTLLMAVERAKGRRSLLSPAESINSLTVGALHADEAIVRRAPGVDPYPTHRMTNLASAVGLGVNRAIKPDVVAFGGRYLAGCSNAPGGSGVLVYPVPSPHYGQEVAAPSSTGNLKHSMRTAGTSNAAALTTRAAHQVADAVEELFESTGGDWRTSKTRAVILKALLAHGCTWEAIGPFLELHYPPQAGRSWSKRRDNITRHLGYGRPDIDRIVAGSSNRITLLADDLIRSGERHEYLLPITNSLLNTKEVRSITLTLGWTTPTTLTSVDPRAVVLSITDEAGKADFWEGVERKDVIQPNMTTARRGTLVHVRLEGARKVKGSPGHARIGVQAMAKKGCEMERAPYALAVTIEIGVEQRSQLYSEVLNELVRTRSRVRQLS